MAIVVQHEFTHTHTDTNDIINRIRFIEKSESVRAKYSEIIKWIYIIDLFSSKLFIWIWCGEIGYINNSSHFLFCVVVCSFVFFANSRSTRSRSIWFHFHLKLCCLTLLLVLCAVGGLPILSRIFSNCFNLSCQFLTHTLNILWMPCTMMSY